MMMASISTAQEKKRRRGTCAQGASSLKYGSCSKGVPPILHPPTGARYSRSSNRFPPRLHCGGCRWWLSERLLSWPRRRYLGKEKGRVSGTSQTPAPSTPWAETFLEPDTLSHRETFFLFHRARPIFLLMSQKENGVHSAGKAGVFAASAPPCTSPVLSNQIFSL